MKICQLHWDMIRESVKSYGMDHLGAKSGEQAIADMKKQLSNTETKDDFDPNMSHHWHWMNGALDAGGLYLMGQNEDGSNEGQYCPICKFVSNDEHFKDKDEIDNVSVAMQAFCRENGLL